MGSTLVEKSLRSDESDTTPCSNKTQSVHIGCEADLAAHVLDVQGRQLSVKGLLDTGAVVSVMPVSTWTDIGFDKSDLIPTNIRLTTSGCSIRNRKDPNHLVAARRETSLDEFPGHRES